MRPAYGYGYGRDRKGSPSAGGGTLPNPVISFVNSGTGTGYAGSTYSVSSGGTGEWWINGAASGIITPSFVEAIADEGKPRYWRRSDGVTSNIIEMWVPSDGTNPVLYIDPRQGLILSGSSVTSQANLVPSGTPGTQVTAGLQPTFAATGFDVNSPCINYDGSDLLTGFGPVPDNPTSRTLIAAMQFGGVGTQGFFDGNTANSYAMRINGTNDLSVSVTSVGARATSNSVVPRDTPLIISSRIDAGFYDFRMAGLSIGSGVPSGGFSGSGSLARTGRDRLGTTILLGKMATMMVYDSLFSVPNVERGEGFIYWSLGLQNQLDASHTYRNAPPRVQ